MNIAAGGNKLDNLTKPSKRTIKSLIKPSTVFFSSS
jgi:hypothetical protein